MSPFFPSKEPQPAPHLPSPHSLPHPSQSPTHIPSVMAASQGPTCSALTRPVCPGSARLLKGRGVTGSPMFFLDPAVGLCFLRGRTSDPWHSCAGLLPPPSEPPDLLLKPLCHFLLPGLPVWVSLSPLFSSGQPRFLYLMGHSGEGRAGPVCIE